MIMKGFGWLVVGALLLGLLYQCGNQKKVGLVTDYCNPGSGEKVYTGEIMGATPVNGGTLFTLSTRSSPCSFKVLLRMGDMERVRVGDVLRFKGLMSGTYLGYRDLEINPRDGVGVGPDVASVDVDVIRWRLFENRNWDGSYWFQLYNSAYGGKRLSIDRRQLSKIRKDGCYRLSWNRNDEVVGVDPCSS